MPHALTGIIPGISNPATQKMRTRPGALRDRAKPGYSGRLIKPCLWA